MRWLIGICCLLFVSMSFAQPAIEWTREINRWNGWLYCIHQTSDGGYILGGNTFPGWPRSHEGAWIVRLSDSGDSLWSRMYSDTGYGIRGVVETLDGGYLWGVYFHSTVLKTNAAAEFQQEMAYQGFNREWDISPTRDGNYLLAGTITLGEWHWGAGLLKVTPNGDSLWCREYRFPDSTVADSATVVPADDGYLIIGTRWGWTSDSISGFVIRTDANGDSLWSRQYGNGLCALNTGQPMADGGFLLAGAQQDSAVPYMHAWLIRLRANGDTVWTREWTDSQVSEIIRMRPTRDGGFIVAGATTGYQLWLAKLDAEGEIVWDRTMVGTNVDTNCADVIQTADSGYAAVTNNAGWRGPIIIKLGPDPRPNAVRRPTAVTPQRLRLHSNYPNPFNSRTTITFDLPVAGHATLAVFDITGRCVGTLSNGTYHSGPHTVSFDGTSLASGIYFCRLEANGSSERIKMVLLK